MPHPHPEWRILAELAKQPLAAAIAASGDAGPGAVSWAWRRLRAAGGGRSVS